MRHMLDSRNHGQYYAHFQRGCGGTGRRAALRTLWEQSRGGSSPLIRIMFIRGDQGLIAPFVFHGNQFERPASSGLSRAQFGSSVGGVARGDAGGAGDAASAFAEEDAVARDDAKDRISGHSPSPWPRTSSTNTDGQRRANSPLVPPASRKAFSAFNLINFSLARKSFSLELSSSPAFSIFWIANSSRTAASSARQAAKSLLLFGEVSRATASLRSSSLTGLTRYACAPERRASSMSRW